MANAVVCAVIWGVEIAATGSADQAHSFATCAGRRLRNLAESGWNRPVTHTILR